MKLVQDTVTVQLQVSQLACEQYVSCPLGAAQYASMEIHLYQRPQSAFSFSGYAEGPNRTGAARSKQRTGSQLWGRLRSGLEVKDQAVCRVAVPDLRQWFKLCTRYIRVEKRVHSWLVHFHSCRCATPTSLVSITNDKCAANVEESTSHTKLRRVQTAEVAFCGVK